MTTIPERFRGEYATRKEAQEDLTVTIGGQEQKKKKGEEFGVRAFIAVDAKFVTVWIKGDARLSKMLQPAPAQIDIQNVVHNETKKTVDFQLVLPNGTDPRVQLANPAPGRYLIHMPFEPLRYLIVAMFKHIADKAREETRTDVMEANPDATDADVDAAFEELKRGAHWDDLTEALLGIAAINFTLGERFTTDTTVPQTTKGGDGGGGGGALPLAVGGGAALILLLMVK